MTPSESSPFTGRVEVLVRVIMFGDSRLQSVNSKKPGLKNKLATNTNGIFNAVPECWKGLPNVNLSLGAVVVKSQNRH